MASATILDICSQDKTQAWIDVHDMTGQDKAPTDRNLPQLRRVKVSELLAGAREVLLEHEGQLYHLRLTANGKLILTK